MNLSKLNKHAQAIPLLTTVVSEGVATDGIDSSYTLEAALILGAAHLKAEKYDTAAEVLAKVWESVDKVQSEDEELFTLLFEQYMCALLAKGDTDGFHQVAREAMARGLNIEQYLQAEEQAD